MDNEELTRLQKLCDEFNKEPRLYDRSPLEIAIFSKHSRAAMPKLIAEVRRLNSWKSIDTAPRDGTRILLWLSKHDIAVSGLWELHDAETLDGHELYDSFYDWFIDNDLYIMDDPSEYPSHWMPLPEIDK